MEESSTELVTSPPGPGAGKSKLDTLSKEDLIKFAKKQMAMLQKMKSKCADLEKEVDKQKTSSNSGTDGTVIQELTERMEAVLLEKAETQQNLVLLRKENEKSKQQALSAQEELTRIREQSEESRSQHVREMEELKQAMDASHAKLKEELEALRRLLKEKEESGQREEVRRQEVEARLESVRQDHEDQLSALRREFETAVEGRRAEEERLLELQEEAARMRSSHEEEVRELTEQMEASAADFEMERERLLLLQEELSEQLSLKDGFLQDVQEEDEEPGRGGAGIGVTRGGAGARGGDRDDEAGQLRLALEDLESQNSMLQEELTYLGNVKAGLEAELLQVKEDFQLEKEELEFKINELQMVREDGEGAKSSEQLQNTALHQEDTQALEEIHRAAMAQLERDLLLRAQEEQEKISKDVRDLRERCDHLCAEKNAALAECEETKENLRNLEAELGERKAEFAKRFDAMKEQGAAEVQELQERLRAAHGESNDLREKLRSLELAAGEAGAEEELRSSLEALQEKNKDILSLLQEKESAVQELEERVSALASEKQAVQGALEEASEELERVRKEQHAEQEKTTELELRLHGLTQEKEAALKRQKELVSALEERKSEGLQAESMLAEAAADREQQATELRSLREEAADLRRREEKLQEEVASSYKDRDSLEERLRSVLEEVTELKQREEKLQEEVASSNKERGSLEERLESVLKEVAELRKTEKVLQEEAASSGKDLEESLRSISEERDRLRTNVDATCGLLFEVRDRVLELLGGAEDGEAQRHGEKDPSSVPALVESLVSTALQGKQNLLLQSEERLARLMEELEEVKERGDQQEVELRARVEEVGREKTLLQGSLDEVLVDTRALQEDLAQMRSANDRILAENQELLGKIATAEERLKEASESQRPVDEDQPLDSSIKEREELQQQPVDEDEPLDKSTGEREELQQLLAEKESLISKLQEDIALLQETKEKSASAGEGDMTSLNDRIAALEKESKEKDERTSKMKAVAVKAKKELDLSRKEVQSLKEEVEALRVERERVSSSMKDIIHGAEGYKNLVAEYDRQTELLDKEKERAERGEAQISELTNRLQAAIQQHEQLSSDREDLVARMDCLQSNVRQLEAQALEMLKLKSALERDLEAEKLLKEQKIKDHAAAVMEQEDLQSQLRRQKQQLEDTAQELEQLRKDAQQSTLMDMEIADYERLVKELNQKLTEKENHVGQLGTEIEAQKQKQEALKEEIESLKSLVDQGEEKASKMKQLLVKTKKDLSDAKKQATAQMVLQASLKGELEGHQQQLEDYKIQCSDLTAERHRLQEQLKTVTEQQQRAAASLQQRLRELQQESSTARAELASTAAEFENYKVRVHNVLKQQKSKSTAQSDGDIGKQEREHMESVTVQLKSRLLDAQQNLQATGAELQQLQNEHDTLLERHNKILQESVTKEAELRERLITLQAENMALKSEHAQTVTQLTAQADSLRAGFREQVRRLQDEHRSTVETLQQQMTRLENQLFQLQKENSTTNSAPAQQARKTLPDRKPSELPLFELQSMAREEGEGMETTETESVSSAGTPLPSLEHLLTSPDPKQELFVWQVEPSKEELAQKLSTATRSMEHMNGLLHETEATNAILMEQITLLKSEMRRLERNQEREKSVSNLEYLKNVLLRFIFLKSGSERQALLPVIDTMLQLNPEEKSRLAAIAQGEEEVAAGSRGSGWTSYLHSWSGIR
ncbi:hypothetical protein GJAV_G00206340 [Gymnothorax javanicus]|nr:hypothetical protein GJAV_G00206340 [Gymnothorax javanicus]